MSENFVIIGGSHGGLALADALRRKGWEGDITLIERQDGIPVQRPPLSKSALKDDWPEERNLIKSADWFEKQHITFKNGTSVTGIDAAGKTVATDKGETIAWTKLALATGASPRKLTCDGADLPNVHYVRVLSDAYGLRDDLKTAQKIVVVGGGYIGLEAAACMKAMGKDVTVLEMADRLLARVATPEMSAFFDKLHVKNGVNVMTGDGITAIKGDGKVEAVVTSSGKELEADAVVVGIGVIPELDLLADIGEESQNGIVVNEDCQTSNPDIYAIGDIVQYNWPMGQLRIESIHNAQYTGALAAHHALGIDKPRYEDPWFWSEQFGYKLQSVGIPADYDEVIWKDGDAEDSGAAFAFRGDELVSVESFNLVPAFMLGKKVFMGGTKLDKEELKAPDADLRALMKKPA